MPIRTPRGLETSLYDAVKSFLEAQGFEVKGEVCGCDIVAVSQREPPVLVVTELKMTLSMELVLQGVERLRAADEVWLAVLATRRGPGSRPSGAPPVPAAGLWLAGGASGAEPRRDLGRTSAVSPAAEPPSASSPAEGARRAARRSHARGAKAT
jgi:hypothetical protein